jgi:hypothetical protein
LSSAILKVFLAKPNVLGVEETLKVKRKAISLKVVQSGIDKIRGSISLKAFFYVSDAPTK